MAGTPAGPKVTGAVALYGGVGPNRSMLGLGYGREAPRVQINYGWVPFFTDLGGPLISFDEIFASGEALISVPLNYYRADVLSLVESVPTAGVGALTFAPGDVGSLAIFEGKTYPIALVFPNSLKTAYRSAGMPPGVRFLAAHVQTVTYSLGLRAQEVNLVWKCKAVFQPASGGFILGDRNVTGLAPFVV